MGTEKRKFEKRINSHPAHSDVKYNLFPGFDPETTEDDMFREANKALDQLMNGGLDETEYLDTDMKQISLDEFLSKHG